MTLTGGSLQSAYLISGILFLAAILLILTLNVKKFVARHPLSQ